MKKLLLTSLLLSLPLYSAAATYTFEAGHESLQSWILPEQPPHPDNNEPTAARIMLGKKLYFDPRLSGDQNMSCATCHNPSLGWADGLPKSKGVQSKELARASPTIINTAYNSIQMWDGREKTLESQAAGPIVSLDEMNMDIAVLEEFLKNNEGYAKLFEEAYPGEGINKDTLSRAIANFERTVISRNSSFDRWVQGDKTAMTEQQIEGFKLFVDPNKGNCEVCHSAPNFTDNGFHNLGLTAFGKPNPDLGRYNEKPIRLMKGAFKTPTLREIENTAPYFHDGSATTLEAVMAHYISGGVVKTNLSPNFKPAKITQEESAAIIAFMKALNSPAEPVTLPVLPL